MTGELWFTLVDTTTGEFTLATTLPGLNGQTLPATVKINLVEFPLVTADLTFSVQFTVSCQDATVTP